MTEPAAQTSHLVLPAPNILAAASGKGGVGKTWFSITLAQALVQQGQRVLLFDGDFGLANVDLQLGLTPKHDLGDVMDEKMTLRQVVQRHTETGIDIIAGRSGSGALANMPLPRVNDIRDQLTILAGDYDRVIIDIGAGVDRLNLHLAALAKTLLIVVTDEQTSWMDGYAFIKKTWQTSPKADVRVVVNMSSSVAEGEKSYQPIKLTAERSLGRAPQLAGIIRRDVKVSAAIKSQTSLLTRYPNTDAAHDVLALAKTL